MFIDGGDVPPQAEVEADLCIVGSGPAAATIASELADSCTKIVLLEAGPLRTGLPGRREEPDAHDAGFSPFHLRSCQFGGTANEWGIEVGPLRTLCRYAPFDQIDFEARDWIPYSGWPFDREELAPYYRRACVRAGIRPFAFDATACERPDSPRPPLSGGTLETTAFQFGPREKFTEALGLLVGGSPSVDCYLNSTALELHVDDAARVVQRLEVGSPGGRRFFVRADQYVLATGGIENARILLLSNRSVPHGLGNRHGLVGRFFMDHYLVHSGYLFPSDRGAFDRARLYDLRVVDGSVVQGKLSFTRDALSRERLLNSATYLVPRHRTAHLRAWGLDSFGALRRSARAWRFPDPLLGHLRQLSRLPVHLGHALFRRAIGSRPSHPWISAGGWSDLPDKGREFASFEVLHLLEQSPHAENRVSLGTRRDPFGRPLAKVRCDLREPELGTIERMQRILAGEFRRSGLGELVLTTEPSARVLTRDGSGHHMGTTRIHPSPGQGVVDVDCKVHGVSNLYVAGSSVFPTGSYANPTLTIVALAIRLADHLWRTSSLPAVASRRNVPAGT